MSLDKENLLFDGQDIAGSAASAGVLDLTVARAIGNIGNLCFEFTVDETFDSAAEDGTLQISIRTDDNAALTSPTTLLTGMSYAEADLVEGAVLRVPVPKDGVERYLNAYATVGGSGNFTAGKLTGGLVIG